MACAGCSSPAVLAAIIPRSMSTAGPMTCRCLHSARACGVPSAAISGLRRDRIGSKTITGACIATLIRDRKLAFDTPLSTSLAKFFAAHGKPVDPRAAGVTIAQLLTHRAGFSGNADDNDVATVRKLVAYLRENSARQPPKPELLITAFKTPLPHQPGSDFVYSNTGYLVLGAIIEEATGKPYLSYCREAVLAPLGVTGDFDPDWQVLGAYGGWRMVGEAFLPILDLF